MLSDYQTPSMRYNLKGLLFSYPEEMRWTSFHLLAEDVHLVHLNYSDKHQHDIATYQQT